MTRAADPATEPYAWRFDDFELRPGSRQLLRGGREVELQAKVFDFIAYLVRNPGRVVDKNELLDAVWPRQVVTEAALSRCAMKARRALGDDAGDPRLLLTLHGRGFRWLLPVERIESVPAVVEPAGLPPPEVASAAAAGLPAPPAPVAAPAAGRAGPRAGSALRVPVLAALLAALLVAVAIAAGSWLSTRSDQALRGAVPLRVAILPVENATGDDRYEWARLGLMGSIGDILRHGSGLRVLPAGETLAFAEASGGEPAERQYATLAQGLGVSHLVVGRLERQPGVLRLSYRLLGPDGQVRRRTVVGADVAAITHAAGADLRAVLGLQRRRDAGIDDEFASEALLRGHARRLQGDVRGALEYFQIAAEQAPQAFWPRFERALGQRDLGDIPAAEAELERLLQETDALADPEPRISTLVGLAIIDWRTGRHELARERLDEALALAERSGDQDRIAAVHTNLGILASQLGDNTRAREQFGHAIQAELAFGQERPSGHLLLSLANAERRDGDLGAAEQHYEQALAQFRLLGERRNEAIALNAMSGLRHRQGRYVESRDLAAQALEVHRALGNRSAEVSAIYALAVAEAELGGLRAAIELAEASLALAEQLGESPKASQARSLLGQMRRDLGEWAAARALFEQALRDYEADADPRQAERQRFHLAQLELAAGDAGGAERQALELLDTLDNGSPQRSSTLRLLVRVRLAAADPEGAAEWLAEAFASADERRSGRDWGWLQALAAEVAIARGRGDEARAAYELAAAELGEHYELLRLAAALAAFEGDPQRAAELERAGREAAGERWVAADEERLRAREAVAGR
jgi:DNA-binding winged helix-turn-helix (wHTH) protein/tetratricopeptide (TPR) repeat protein/TolB-like protein